MYAEATTLHLASVNGCVSVGARLQSRGLQIDPQCVRCGMAPETVNHMLFECPPALQVWALSPIPTALDHFPTGGLFTNIAHLFWNLPNDERMGMYPWLLWFIWKARNDKVFSNDDSDPNDIINHAASEAVAWRTAQETRGHTGLEGNPAELSRQRRGISPLQAELEALVWAMQCMLRQKKLTIVFETDCSDVVKMVSKPEEWPAFAQY
ncbi:unnamed protein product [Microthlaspi erraticum]|uniref:Reverse transcriptase zinc-binding domain-containing protein n=1 Tax=Microthlaspi erraticum TaxID=1685480 RepID=A0A6D2JCC4_9BRAS|nr:unnamed protein product [Microthlaspi erraticum]